MRHDSVNVQKNNSVGHEFQKIFSMHGYEKAELFLENSIKFCKGTRKEFDARFLRARGYEAGWFGSVNFQKAMNDYIHLIRCQGRIDDNIYAECLLGCARIHYLKKENINEIKRLCDIVVSINGNHKALTLLGFSYENIKNDYKLASKYYLLSFLKGSKRALAYYSYAKYKSGKYISGSISLILYYILYPLLSIFDKSKYYLY